MKKILFTILFLTSLTALSAQLQDSFLLVGAAGTFSTVNDSTFRGTVTFQTDQFGSGYLPTGIQVNYKLIDAKGDIFTVTVVNSSNFTTANIDVEEDDADRTAPAGIVMVFKVLDSGLYPLPPVNSTGASPIMQARLLTDNAIMASANDNKLDSISQSGRTFTFNVGDSTYSMNSVDTFYLENGVYKIVVGSDTLTANLDLQFGNALYVSENGNDATAIANSVTFPWARIDSAYANASNGDYIVVLPGETISVPSGGDIDLSENKDFNLIISSGSTINITSSTYLLTIPSGIDSSDINIYGSNGTILSTSSGRYLWRATSGNSSVDINVDVGVMNKVNWGFNYANDNAVINLNSSLCANSNSCGFMASSTGGSAQMEDCDLLINIDKVIVIDSVGNSGAAIFTPFSSGFGGAVRSNVVINIGSAYIENKHSEGGGLGIGFFSQSDDHGLPKDINYAINFDYLEVNLASEYVQHTPLDVNNPSFQMLGFRGHQQNANFSVHAEKAIIKGQSISNDFRGDGTVADSTKLIFTGNWEFINALPFDPVQSNTSPCANCEMIFEGNFIVDSTMLFDRKLPFDIKFKGIVETTNQNTPPIITDNDFTNNFILSDVEIINKGNHPPIQGQTNTVILSGDVTINQDTIDSSINYQWRRNIGSNSIYDRLLFGSYTIDQNTSSLRLDTLNQFVVVTENSQSYYSLGGNIEIRADSGNVVLNGGPTGELKMQGDSLTSAITGAGVSNDGMTGVFVQNDAGETRLTSRLLPQFDTVNVSTANDTIDIDFAFDQTVVVNMNSAPATVDFVVQNPVKGSTLTLVFTSVGSSHTFNFGHVDIQLGTKTGWTIDSSSAKVYVLRYNIDGGGDWIIVRDE